MFLLLGKKICFSRVLIRPLKIVYSEFHSLTKFKHFSIARKEVAQFVAPRRNFFWIFKKRTKKEIRATDQPPEHYQLVYRNGIDHYFLVVQYGVFFMSVTVTLLAIYNFENWSDTPKKNINRDARHRPQAANDNVLYFLSAFLFTVCLLYFHLARTPMRIYYYPEGQKYLMYFYGPVPNQVKKQTINVGEIQPLPDKGISPWSHLTFQHKTGQKLLLFENYFRYPADLHIMLGLQKDSSANGYEKAKGK